MGRMSGGVLTRAPRACVLLFSGSLLCCGSRLRRIVSMCEFKLEIMSVEVWKKKKSSRRRDRLQRISRRFHLPFSSAGSTSPSRLCALCGLRLWTLCDADSLTHGRNMQCSIKAQLQFSYLLHWDMWCVVSRLICGCKDPFKGKETG